MTAAMTSIPVHMLPTVMTFTGQATYRKFAFTCKGGLPPLEQRKYILLYTGADHELETIESHREKTEHQFCRGEFVCELCLGAAQYTPEVGVVIIEINSLPWLPRELFLSESLQDFIIANWNTVDMRICLNCLSVCF